MAAIYVSYYKGTQMLMENGNAGTDAWKLCLSNTAPTVATDTTVVGELTTSNGYTAGGVALTIASHTLTGGTYNLTLTIPSPTWTSSTGSMGPFRYVILYDSTTSQCVAYWDYGSGLILNGANGDTFTATVSGAIISITGP